MTYTVSSGTLNSTIPYHIVTYCFASHYLPAGIVGFRSQSSSFVEMLRFHDGESHLKYMFQQSFCVCAVLLLVCLFLYGNRQVRLGRIKVSRETFRGCRRWLFHFQVANWQRQRLHNLIYYICQCGYVLAFVCLSAFLQDN